MVSSLWHKLYCSTNNLPVNPTAAIGLSKPHKVQGFADVTIISSTSEDHGKALQEISNSCHDLDLTLTPTKCISFVVDGKKMNKLASFKVGTGVTRNISSGPTKFLGHLQGITNKSTTCEARKRFIESFQPKLENLDQTKIRGEYKIWIYKWYLVPSFLFALSVDSLTDSVIKKMQAAALRKVKSWLNLSKSFAASALHHPNLIDIPELMELKTKAKLMYLASITTYWDPLIKEIVSNATYEKYTDSQKIPSSCIQLLAKAKSSVASITSKTLNTQL